MRNPIRSVQDLTQFQVNRKDQMEVIRQTFYDTLTYAAAGQTVLTFYAVPVGQGAPAKTLAETNMNIAGSLPAPFRFLTQAIEVYFFPGVLPGVGPIADAADGFLNDMWKVMTGWTAAGVFHPAFLQFFIGSKAYLNEGVSLMRFPPFGRLDGFAAMTTDLTAGAATFSRDSYVTAAGRPYIIDPPILVEPTQNFNVTLNWPTAVVPIVTAGEIAVVLNGVLVRNSQ
jgi:hypothetical protein